MKAWILTLGVAAGPACADPAQVVDASARQVGETWTFDVTVAHPDTGWDDYADGWRVMAPDGTELGMRVLAHPHVNEQPFTRSLSGVVIPEGMTEVVIEVRDSVTGWSPEGYALSLE